MNRTRGPMTSYAAYVRAFALLALLVLTGRPIDTPMDAPSPDETASGDTDGGAQGPGEVLASRKPIHS